MQKIIQLFHLNHLICNSLKMATKSPMECVKENAKITKNTINYLKDEVSALFLKERNNH